MTTLADLRGRLRTLLNDSAAGAYLWSDAALNLHLGAAVQSYGRCFPLEKQVSISTIAGRGEYDLPADCARVVRVECGDFGSVPMQEGGDAFGEGYEVYGGRLVMLPAPTESGWSVSVGYLAPHFGLMSDGDVSTVPVADEDLLLAFAAAMAIEWLVADQAKRERFEARYGQSAIVVAGLYRSQYEAGIRERGRVVRTRRLVGV